MGVTVFFCVFLSFFVFSVYLNIHRIAWWEVARRTAFIRPMDSTAMLQVQAPIAMVMMKTLEILVVVALSLGTASATSVSFFYYEFIIVIII